ncbi:di-heme-cytochrome C peroxidase [Nitrosomonas sp. HPC101]|uniref:di-heme-cytochrome C peroxidase n=1 Tax=Nitrosomonas sp. HPC101 TaxID=1658667 RepID=UPI00195F473B
MLKIRLVSRIASIFSLLLPAVSLAAEPVAVDQGSKWTASARNDFYSRDQGSRLIPLRWIAALKQPNGKPFMDESLDRYGYLPNKASVPAGLPVGFTVTNEESGQVIGMNCSACHTRQIEVAGTAYRIDGGPGIVDFQSFLADLDVAVNTVLTNQQAFADFAHAVLGPSPDSKDQKKLREEVEAWHLPYHTLVKRALPSQPWGPARLDAVSMIFNRLAGLDIGPAPTYMIPENIQPATAPVRYPFLWNAGIQDKTQWPGFANNGNKILGLSRNLGEVFGVFGIFHPKKDKSHLLGIDYQSNNSANFQGLIALEKLMNKIGAPKWPWKVDQTLASKGKTIYERKTAEGGCADCHGIMPGDKPKTWKTPIMDVGTDSKEYEILGRTVKTGVLEGAKIPFLAKPLKPVDTAFSVLGTAVLGTILQHYVPIVMRTKDMAQIDSLELSALPPETESLQDAFIAPPAVSEETSVYAYESRVLEGIWAAAPYLHNGSVPTLAELLKPAAERVSSFKIGPIYDTVNIGIAVEQTKFDYTLQTTDCSDRNSGNSRCGHEFGTTLSPDDKKALLEYLKTL